MSLENFQGTPLPWYIRESGEYRFVESSRETIKRPYGQEILADDYWNDDWREHDVNLINAAPKLYSALEEAITGLEWRKNNTPEHFDKADQEKIDEWKRLLKEAIN